MCEAINLGNISKQFSYSLSGIKRVFDEETGSSIITYLNNLRMEKAKELLRDKRVNIGEIAIKAGFTNTYFFKCIKKDGEKVSQNLEYNKIKRYVEKRKQRR